MLEHVVIRGVVDGKEAGETVFLPDTMKTEVLRRQRIVRQVETVVQTSSQNTSDCNAVTDEDVTALLAGTVVDVLARVAAEDSLPLLAVALTVETRTTALDGIVTRIGALV